MEHDPDGARGGPERRLDPVSVYFILFLGRPGEIRWPVFGHADGRVLSDFAQGSQRDALDIRQQHHCDMEPVPHRRGHFGRQKAMCAVPTRRMTAKTLLCRKNWGKEKPPTVTGWGFVFGGAGGSQF